MTQVVYNNGVLSLDNNYPYEPSPYVPSLDAPGVFDADSSIDISADGPSDPLGPLPDVTSVTAHDSFRTWMMYRPPGGGQFVPLAKFRWYWSARADYDGSNWVLHYPYDDIGESRGWQMLALHPGDFPLWLHILLNSDLGENSWLYE